MQILNKVDQLTKVLQSLQPIPTDRKNILDKKFRLEFNYNSNHIEGNTLTYGETELLLIFDDTKGNHQMREYEEMKAHDIAYKKIEEWADDKERPLMEVEIKNLNRIILVRPFWKDAITSDGQSTRRQIKIGDYKDMPNSVRLQNGEIFEYASPMDTPIKMQELIDWYRKEEEDKVHPVKLAAMLHYNFVRIHPFDDGNGRIARLLLNYVLLRNNLPPVIIKSVDKANYLRALNRADVGDTEAFVEYIAEQLIWSLDISIKAAKGESIDEPGDLDKKLAALKKRMGQKGDEKVVETHNLKSVVKVTERLGLLIEKWENKLRHFDPLFYSRSYQIVSTEFTDRGRQFEVLENKGAELYKDYSKFIKVFLDASVSAKADKLDEIKTTDLGEIDIDVSFENLRAKNNKKHYDGGRVQLLFHTNFYEILMNEKSVISKLYHEVLNEEEMDSIVETLGNQLFRDIELDIDEETEGV
jgi:Fic family protein